MPDIDGFRDLPGRPCRTKNPGALAGVPIIFLTGEPGASEARRHWKIAVGRNDFLAKTLRTRQTFVGPHRLLDDAIPQSKAVAENAVGNVRGMEGARVSDVGARAGSKFSTESLLDTV